MIKLSQGLDSCSGWHNADPAVAVPPNPQIPKSSFSPLIKNNDEHEHFSVVAASLVNGVTKPGLA